MIVLEKHLSSLLFKEIYFEFEKVLGDFFTNSAQEFLKTKNCTYNTITATNQNVSTSSVSYNTADKVMYIPDSSTADPAADATCNFYFDQTIKNSDKYNFARYEEIVEWALWLCQKDIPTPYKHRVSDTCHAIFITGTSVFIRFPNNIGIMVILTDDGGFDLNIIFYQSYNNSEYFIKHSTEYCRGLNSFNWNISDRTTLF